jgi:site-specific DNA-cytosine methylase
VKSSRAQTSDDSETWVEGKVNPTLNSFDQGDVRATTAIVEELMLIDGTRVDDVRIYEEPVQTLKERMGTGGNNVPMLAFDTQFGSNANVTENIAPTLKSSQAPPSVAYDPEPTVFQPGTMIRLNGGIWEGTVPTLRAEAKRGDNEPHIQIHNAEPTMAVRRLTPLECERLMGWPDDHTRYKADGTEQADTHRYKQCGNGVASPVAQWIAKHLLKL